MTTPAAATRKYNKALKPFEKVVTIQRTRVEVRPRAGYVEFHTYFADRGVDYRFDFGIKLDEPLPKVAAIRERFWGGLREYQSSLDGALLINNIPRPIV